MRKIAIFLAGMSAVYFIMPVFLAMFILLQLRGAIDVMPVVALVATMISLFSAGLLAIASKPGSFIRSVSILFCIDLALLAFATILAIGDSKSFLSDPVSVAESAWIALLMALAPLFTALVLSLPGPRRSIATHIIIVISALISAFTMFSIVMIFRDLMLASTIHAMLPLLWVYWAIEMPIIGICILSMAVINRDSNIVFKHERAVI